MRATRDLEWPADPDLYRDIAQAQTIADGSLLSDPFYRGETVWHNPLMPLVVAAFSRLLGLPVHTAYVRLGAYWNLLGPIAFYLWVARLAGAAAATVATFGFVFHHDTWAPDWVTAAYSPWLFAMTSSQGLFYASLILYREALLRGSLARYAASGLVVGLTFLAAAPPALILGGIAATGCVCGILGWLGPRPAVEMRPDGTAWRMIGRHVLFFLTALLGSAVFLYSIGWRYRLRVLNPSPMSWEWAGFGGPSSFLSVHFGWPAALAALAALAVIGARRRCPVDAALLGGFALTALALLAHRWFFEQAGILFPQFVPSHYFVFYLKALQWALVGLAVQGLWSFRSRFPSPAGVRLGTLPPGIARAALMAVVALGVLFTLPQYRSRGYLQSARQAALAEAGRPHLHETFAWLRANASPDDVFLASPDTALRVIGPAGRKVVLVGEVFSNPYVDWSARARSTRAMWRALLEGDLRTFRALARAFHVTYLISWRQDQPWLDALLEERNVPGLSSAFKSGGVRILELTP